MNTIQNNSQELNAVLLNQKSRFVATTSDHYKVITTNEVVKILESQGFILDSIVKTRVSRLKSEKNGYQKHFLTLNHPLMDLTELKPTLLVVNSYDGSSALELRIGIHRKVCSNGLVTGSDFQTFKIRHVGNVADKIKVAALAVLPQMRSAVEACSLMSRVTLTEAQAYQFAVKASKIVDKTLINVSDLLKVRRREDQFQDLFTVFNRIQENLVSGAFYYLNENSKMLKARRITSPKRLIEVNAALWDIAMEYVA